MARYSTSSLTSITARPPSTLSQCWSWNITFSSGSWNRVGTSRGRTPARKLCSAIRAERLLERTEEKVATPRTRVPTAVPSEAMVERSAMA